MSELRLAIDTGGTFTDLVIDDRQGALSQYKAPTTPQDPVDSMIDVLGRALGQRASTRYRC